MSYDIAIVAPPIPEDDAAAWPALETAIAMPGGAHASLLELHDRLVRRYPCLSTLGDDDLEAGVWASGPIGVAFEQPVAVLAIQRPRVDEVVPIVVDEASTLGLVVFDWQTRHVYRPEGDSTLTLTLEGGAAFRGPTKRQMIAASAALDPDCGPGFLIVEATSGDYIQVAGGNGRYVCEWRQYRDERFEHWVAGVHGVPDKRETRVATNGAHVTVRENEVLGGAAVQALLETFAEKSDRPRRFHWRDISAQFG